MHRQSIAPRAAARRPRMNSQPSALTELIAGHLEDNLDAAQREQLNQMLKSSPEARTEFMSARRQDILLGEVLRDRAERKPAATTVAAAWRPSLLRENRRWALIAGAAALVA